ncbi:hypothetical protein [Legionella impletisoli]|uniref:T2SS substrate NttA domain-containing protein n=1 Tax=Legionella impletisoli TaxID=343510 RepID=A0A917JT78_9GAMM|nr:hypothetical protein [Legionella impletisoli]GGI85442.1 hypothetical protein GCM10007966_12590 [Legionella impletisoli]
MAKCTHYNKGIGLSMILYSALALAANDTTSQTPNQNLPYESPGQVKPVQVPKDQWLEQVRNVVPEPICKGFLEDPSIAGRFKEMGVTYDKCLKEIPDLADACIKKYNDKLPDMMTQESASKWGRLLGECIGASFAKIYLYADVAPGAIQQEQKGKQQPKKPTQDNNKPQPSGENKN